MVPLLAATSAISAVSSVAENAITAWQSLVETRFTSKSAPQGANPGQEGDSSASGSFSALLSAQGIHVAGSGGAGQAGAAHGAGQHEAGHRGGHHQIDLSA